VPLMGDDTPLAELHAQVGPGHSCYATTCKILCIAMAKRA
jgi:hypothetical protein